MQSLGHNETAFRLYAAKIAVSRVYDLYFHPGPAADAASSGTSGNAVVALTSLTSLSGRGGTVRGRGRARGRGRGGRGRGSSLNVGATPVAPTIELPPLHKEVRTYSARDAYACFTDDPHLGPAFPLSSPVAVTVSDASAFLPHVTVVEALHLGAGYEGLDLFLAAIRPVDPRVADKVTKAYDDGMLMMERPAAFVAHPCPTTTENNGVYLKSYGSIHTPQVRELPVQLFRYEASL